MQKVIAYGSLRLEPDFFHNRRINRVLIYRLGSLGDTVVSLPCLHLVARSFPSATRIMLTNRPVHVKAPSVRSVIGESGLVHDYINYTVGTRNLSELARMWWQIRQYAPDILIYLAAPRGEKAIKRDQSFFRLCGIRTIIGAPLGDLASPRYNEQTGMWEHEALRLTRTIAPLGDANPSDLANWDLKWTDAELREANETLAPLGGQQFLVAGIGTKMQAKDWGVEKWGALIRQMALRFPRHALVFVGAKDDSELSDRVAGGWQGETLNLCGRLAPRETAAVLRHAELFLGPDSGPMHLAAAVGTPCAIAFSARGKPGPWYPYGAGHQVVYHKTDCYGCNLETCIEQQRKCLESIQVDEMFGAVMRAWQHGRQLRETQAV
jgi:heptosyltransferase-3